MLAANHNPGIIARLHGVAGRSMTMKLHRYIIISVFIDAAARHNRRPRRFCRHRHYRCRNGRRRSFGFAHHRFARAMRQTGCRCCHCRPPPRRRQKTIIQTLRQTSHNQLATSDKSSAYRYCRGTDAGTDEAVKCIRAAIKLGKPVVTANKESHLPRHSPHGKHKANHKIDRRHIFVVTSAGLLKRG